MPVFREKKSENALFLPVFRVIGFALGVARVGIQKLAKFCRKEGGEGLTDKQREEIRKLRLSGLGYKMIAKLIDSKESNVYEYCKAHGLSGTPELVKLNYPIWCEQNNRCAFCGSKLKQPKVGRRRRFCSGSCRTRYCRAKKP